MISARPNRPARWSSARRVDVTRRLAAIAGTAAALVIAITTPVSAHATYESSNPPDGGTVVSPPSQVSAEFSEPLIPEGSFMDVTDPCGSDVGGGTTVAASNMTVEMSGAAQGVYVVTWRAGSSVDGHVTNGSFSFTSTTGDPCPGEGGEEEEGSSDRPADQSGGSGVGKAGAASAGGAVDSDDQDVERGTRSAGTTNRSQEGPRKPRGVTKAGESDEERKDEANEAAALVAPIAAESSPSALEGIPLTGLFVTFAFAAMIGAAAGKIFVALHGD